VTLAKNLHKSSAKLTIIGCILLSVMLSIYAVRLQSHLSIEYDEGVYLTTYNLVRNGFNLYQPTYYSQLPGFFSVIYPFFLLLGSTLQAARLAIFSVSLIGLLAVVWVSWELETPIVGFLAIGVLYLFPIYIREVLTFHADVLPPTFSTLALASAMRYSKQARRKWVIASAFFASIAILVKADFSILPSLFLIFVLPIMMQGLPRRKVIKSLGLFVAVVSIVLFLGIAPFGLANVYRNVIVLRVLAYSVYALNPMQAIGFLQQPFQLVMTGTFITGMILAALLAYRDRSKIYPLVLLAVWVIVSLGMLFLYRPIWQHHFVILAIPVSLLFAYSLYGLFNVMRFSRVLHVAVPILLVVILACNLNRAFISQPGLLSASHKKGIQLVQSYTNPDDYIISDDGMVTGISGRMTPPDLADLSLVRVQSGSLSSDDFINDLKTYKPKMVLVWAGQLSLLPSFTQTLTEFHYTLISDPNQKQKAYLLMP
jgi:4-amino-4-deoxy-L-arabinose transferase-like glycosyltransferase